MTDGNETSDLKEMWAAARAEEAKAMADMFFTPGICKRCGAQVAIQEQHKAFHDGIDDWMSGVMKAFQKAGFETRQERAARWRVKSATPESGDTP